MNKLKGKNTKLQMAASWGHSSIGATSEKFHDKIPFYLFIAHNGIFFEVHA